MNELANYGVLGVVLIVFAIWYAKKDAQHREERKELERTHREERDEWRKYQETRDEKMNKVIDNNTGALNSFKTLFESNLNKK